MKKNKKRTEERMEAEYDVETLKSLIRRKQLQTSILKKIIEKTNHSQTKKSAS